jgi:hypothetical protein
MKDYGQFLSADAVLIYPSRGKLFLFSFLAAALVVRMLSLWPPIGRTRDQVIVAVGIIFFAQFFIWSFRRLIRRKPSLIINHLGLVDDSSAIGGVSLRWDEVESIYISSMWLFGRFLSIRPRNSEKVLAGQTPVKAWLMRMNLWLVGAPVNISAGMLPVSVPGLVQQIQAKCPGVQVLLMK